MQPRGVDGGRLADIPLSTVIGIQNHTLARLFLLRFDPKIPRVGPRRRVLMEASDVRHEYCMITQLRTAALTEASLL